MTMMILWQTIGQGQNQRDYIVLRSGSDNVQLDTVFGRLYLPENGIFSGKIKIRTNSELKKFKAKNVRCLETTNLHFASIKYGASYAIVPRVIEGPLELYFYYTGADRLSFIPIDANHFIGEVEYDDLEPAEAIWNKTSYFYLSEAGSDVYFKVPKSEKKFMMETPEFFSDNDELYERINNKEFRPNQIPLITKLYNDALSQHTEPVVSNADSGYADSEDTSNLNNQNAQEARRHAQADTISVKKIAGSYRFYQGQQRLRWNQLLGKVESNEDVYWRLNSARNTNVLANVVGALGGFTLGWSLGTALAGGEASAILVISGVGLIVASIPIAKSSYKKAKQAVERYNNGSATSSLKSGTELKLAATSSGLGLVWSF